MRNQNMNKAKAVKNDEFYTKLSDIENELKHYKKQFKGKKVLCNCDDPEWSNFWRYFILNFERLGLQKLVATHYKTTSQGYVLSATLHNGEVIVEKIMLEQNGDFRSPESISYLIQSDIVVTNPPFSLFREFIELLMKFNKKFLIIGNKNSIVSKHIFQYFMSEEIWLGVNSPREFLLERLMDIKDVDSIPVQKFGNIGWFTNLEHNKRNEVFDLWRTYYDGVDQMEYKTYDNYNAINIDRVANIPKDYYKEMGVPLSFMDKINPNQFEIVGLDRYMPNKDDGKRFYIDGREKYARIVIRRRRR